ncbi:MAG: hypothetical protein BZ136_06695 [Methanosphaera sp. rholeuAM74]|nr:MAG: hypothetical protein BZ136_06695 [Methanosphaera sp. rholeuAM74]
MLNDTPIKYKKSTHRSVNPEETLKKVSEVTSSIGLTRTSNITHLDRLNIPVYTSIRPLAHEGAVSVYAGKGPTDVHAKVSSIMEAIERYSAEMQGNDETYVQAYDSSSCLNPNDLILPSGYEYVDEKLEWVMGKSVTTDDSMLVPANATFHPYNNDSVKHLFLSNTNGLASGNVLEEAVFHGMMEVVERDSWSFFEAYKMEVPEVVCQDSEDEYIKSLLSRFREANVDIKLLDLTRPNGITTIGAVSDDLSLKDPALLTLGIGTHLDPKIAAIRAITEVAQSRATQIHGTREDAVRANLLRETGYERMKRINKHWFGESTDYIHLDDMEDRSKNTFKEDIDLTMKLLREDGVEDAYYVDLTRDIQIPVVRVIIPKMELFSVDSSRVGDRLKPDTIM